ncbi:MAG: lipopolysaccharide heptosyltransferase II [Candidatus Rokubacteria bacterium]|nr:lipopolysaccharide heptosyltransferase II [Candidatus Rokubacteria bacterium]
MTRPAAIPTAGVRRVLVRAPNWLGDTVMAIPTVRALRRGLPAAEMWCLGRWVVPILEGESAVDRLVEHPRDWAARVRLAGDLRRAGIDLAVLLPNSFEAALHAWLGGARLRLGYAGDGRSALLTHALPPPAGRRHQVAAYLDLLGPLGLDPVPSAPTLEPSPARRAEARRLLAGLAIAPAQRAVAIQLGAAFGPSKLWPADRLAALAAALERDGTPAVFLGGRAAAPLLAAVERALARPPRSLVGADHPALLPALLAEFAAVVAPDSGPAHVAAAVGVPVVALFGPTDPRLTGPAGPGHAVLWRRPPCAPCFQPVCPIDHRCLRAITVEDVLAAVRERMPARPGR